MTTLLRRFTAALVAAFGLCLPASATSFGTNYTDIWFNPSESGWGVNLIQQHDTIFATLFVYGTAGQPHWFVASDLRGSQNSFSGTLYQTTGPVFSAPWTGGGPAVPVGSMTLSFSGVNSGSLTYVANGQTVNKQIQRQSFRTNNIAGNYIGGMTANATGCANPADNGLALVTGLLAVTPSGNTVSMRVGFEPSSCTFSGTLQPVGRLGTITGSYTCTVGSVGTFTMSEVETSKSGFTAVFTGRDQFCNYSGFFGGVRDVL